MVEEKKKGVLDWYFKTNLLARILIGLILGAIVGIILGFFPSSVKPFVDNSKFFGDLFIRLLKMIVVPVVLFSLVAGAASIAPSRLGRVGVKILVYYLLTSAFAVLIGLIFANIFQPGAGFNVVGDAAIKGKEATAPTLVQILLNIVPTNPFESLMKGDVLPIIFFAVVFGIGLSYIKDSKQQALAKSGTVLLDGVNAAAETMYKVVRGIMQYAPIGVFVLIAQVFAQQGPKAIGPLLMVTLAVYVALIVHLVVTYGGLLSVYKLGFWKFLKGANEAMITAFVSCLDEKLMRFLAKVACFYTILPINSFHYLGSMRVFVGPQDCFIWHGSLEKPSLFGTDCAKNAQSPNGWCERIEGFAGFLEGGKDAERAVSAQVRQEGMRGHAGHASNISSRSKKSASR